MTHRIERIGHDGENDWSIRIYFSEWSELGIGMKEIMGELVRRGVHQTRRRPWTGFGYTDEEDYVEFYSVAKQGDGSENGEPPEPRKLRGPS